jgi:hypothetical protein
MTLFLYDALKDIKSAKSNLAKEYGYERYSILLSHVENELKKDLERIEALENKQDILDLIPARKEIN